MWVVYLLRLGDGSHYVGMTQRLESRLQEHQAGRGPYVTRTRLPVVLLWFEEVPDAASARRLEQWLKRRSRTERADYIAGHGQVHVPEP